MRIYLVIVAVLHISMLVDCANKLGKDKYLTTSSIQMQHGYVYGAEAFIGESGKSKTSIDYFDYNFGLSESAIGDFNTVNWGVECDENSKEYNTTCEVTSKDIHSDFYYWMLYKYKKAKLHMRFFKEASIEVTDKSKMPIQLVVDGQKWPISTYGVLGLAPNGSFANYVRELYDDDLSLMFGFPSYESDSNDRLHFKTHIVQNPSYEANNVAGEFISNLDNYWWLRADIENPGKPQDTLDAKLCLTSIADEIILVQDAELYCYNILKKACGPKDPKECTSKDIDMKTMPDLNITIQSKRFNFKADEYLYFNSKGFANCRIGDLSDAASLELCPLSANAGLGRLFYNKYIPIFTFNKDGKSTLTFLYEYKFIDQRGHLGILIGTVITLILVFLFLYILARKKRQSDEEYYVTSDI